LKRILTEWFATTNEMTRNAGEAASGANGISVNIAGVAQAADGTLLRAQESQKAAEELSSIAAQLGQLMQQFKIERSDPRYKIVVPVKLKATDAKGQVHEHEAKTVDISKGGALLKDVRGEFQVGNPVWLARLDKVEKFRIAWVGGANTERRGQIGVCADHPATSFWSDLIETIPEVELAA
jgi:hypothetical protein